MLFSRELLVNTSVSEQLVSSARKLWFNRWHLEITLLLFLMMGISMFLISPPSAYASSVAHHPATIKILPQDPHASYWRNAINHLNRPQADNCSVSEVQYETTTFGAYSVTTSLWVPFGVASPYNFCGYVYGISYVSANAKSCVGGTITAEVAIRNAGLHGGNDPVTFPSGITQSGLSISDDVSVSAGTYVTAAGVLKVGPQYIGYSAGTPSNPQFYDIPSRNG